MATRKESSPASSAPMASTAGTLDSPVKQIQIDGLASEEISACWFIREAIRRSSIRGLFQRHVVCVCVVLKIIKHYQEEGQGSEVVQGVLLGLVVDDRLEITNCFPFPQHTEDDADFDEGS
ncbi:Eukaryotic translation initiation factor 3 subunit H [Xenoophorus captivus]|uniref:Eukaryotic translation initiation factor 3 subunit H n=1 Tax=Xenoophorus captivus TaxID=1517983 RepID=A0ABV0R3E5_9TELE